MRRPSPTATLSLQAIRLHDPTRLLFAATTALAIAGCSSEQRDGAGITFSASAQQLMATWTNNATNADGIYVDRCGGADCTAFSRLGSLPPSATTYIDTTVQAAATYCYRVGAFNNAGIGWSTVACATVPDSPVEPPQVADAAVGPPVADGGSPPASDFPIDMTSTPPETQRATLVVSMPAQATETVLTLEQVIDPDFADEGSLTINGHGPVALFGEATGGDRATIDVTFATPATWWRDGANELVFTHDRTNGYVIGGASVSFSVAPSPAPNPDAAAPPAPEPDAGLPSPAPPPDASPTPPAPDAGAPPQTADAAPSPSGQAQGDVSCRIVTNDEGTAQVACDVSNLETGCSLAPNHRCSRWLLGGAVLLLALSFRRRRRRQVCN